MSSTPRVRLKKILWRRLVEKLDPESRKTEEIEYRFSGGRTFTRNKNRNRAA